MRVTVRKPGGFTIVELLVTLSIVVILATLAVPSFNDSRLGSNLRGSANDLVASASFARGEAIKRGTVVTICASSNGTSCTGSWQDGWIVLSGAQLLYKEPAVASGFHINAAGGITTFSFQPTGIDSTAGSLTICRATPSVGSQERVVTINAAGRASAYRTATGACS